MASNQNNFPTNVGGFVYYFDPGRTDYKANALKAVMGLGVPYAAKSANYTILISDLYLTMDATGGARTFTLPTAVGVAGQIYIMKKIDASVNAVTIATTSAQTIETAATKTLAARWNGIAVISDGANWQVLWTV